VKKLENHDYVAGIDEAGRGPLAGPVVAATVVLNPEKRITGLNDSKVLSAKVREELAAEIMDRATYWAVAQASVEEIDELNILQASLLAMQRSCLLLTKYSGISIQRVLVDGTHTPDLPHPCEAVIKGDSSVPDISAASIVAKVTRDHIMRDASRFFPEYGFDEHKGYATRAHLNALQEYGPCKLHRHSFQPVHEAKQFLFRAYPVD